METETERKNWKWQRKLRRLRGEKAKKAREEYCARMGRVELETISLNAHWRRYSPPHELNSYRLYYSLRAQQVVDSINKHRNPQEEKENGRTKDHEPVLQSAVEHAHGSSDENHDVASGSFRSTFQPGEAAAALS